jgi:hypothetical protein
MGVSQFFSKLCGACCGGRSKDSIYDPVLADSEREAVADLLGFLENVPPPVLDTMHRRILTSSSAPRLTSSPASPSAR